MSEPAAGLGVSVSAQGLDAALALPNAQGAWVCLYDGDREVLRAPMSRDAQGVLRGHAPGYAQGARYGFRVEGPYNPAIGGAIRPIQTACRPLRVALRPALSPSSVDVRVW